MSYVAVDVLVKSMMTLLSDACTALSAMASVTTRKERLLLLPQWMTAKTQLRRLK
jgi:hypothetical protein